MKALVLLSGGLDSVLATRVILEQGLEVEAINFVSVFCTCTPKTMSCSAARTAVEHLGIPLKTVNTTAEFLELVRKPRHGYGRNLNPCLDCRILMLRTAHKHMLDTGASFLVTGEVLGERPMSQRRDAMALIEREAGVEGLVVRPLSARLLKPSLPEQRGWVDREKLLSIKGRSRRPQISLAAAYGIRDYPCPAGGCLLTDAGFAGRMRDLMQHRPGFTVNDVQLLKVGHHFRLSAQAMAVVGRNEAENARLVGLAEADDLLVELVRLPGPTTLVRGPTGADDLRRAAVLTARHSKVRDCESVELFVWSKRSPERRTLTLSLTDRGELPTPTPVPETEVTHD